MKSYLITDPSIYTNNINDFENTLNYTIQNNNIDFICFRDKESSNYKQLAISLVDISKSNNISNIFINSYIDLAYSLNATGVHLTSEQFNKIAYAKNIGLKTIISCHNEIDIQKAIKYKADYLTYSPIFDSPNKGKSKGLDDLKYITNKYKDVKIFALGGIISNSHIDMINSTNAYGFASIRYFIK
jgi:thiamine-phosphate pyrophosphorylase